MRRTTAGGVATVVASQSRHALIISTSGLPALHGGTSHPTTKPIVVLPL